MTPHWSLATIGALRELVREVAPHLQTLRASRVRSAAALLPMGTLGAGVAVGAAAGLLPAPKPGRELRHELRHELAEKCGRAIGAARGRLPKLFAGSSRDGTTETETNDGSERLS